MRLTLDTTDAINLSIKLKDILKSDLANSIDFTGNDNQEIRQLIEQIETNLTKPKHTSKQRAIKKATIVRRANVAYNTAKRYSYLIY